MIIIFIDYSQNIISHLFKNESKILPVYKNQMFNYTDNNADIPAIVEHIIFVGPILYFCL